MSACKKHPDKPRSKCWACPKAGRGFQWCRCGKRIPKEWTECHRCLMAGTVAQHYENATRRERFTDVRDHIRHWNESEPVRL